MGDPRAVTLAEVTALSERLRAERSRNAKIDLIAEVLARAPREEVGVLTAWLVGDLGQGRIGLGWATVAKAGADLPAEPAPEAGAPLTVGAVDAAFDALSTLAGAGSSSERVGRLRALLSRCGAAERSFLVHLMMGEMRQGAQEGVVMAAVARAFGAGEALVRRATMLSGSLPQVAARLASDGPGALAAIGLRMFVPVQPMLADTADDLEALADSIGEQLVEAKLDGARVQAHVERGVVRVYSRALNEVTHAIPEVVAELAALPVAEAILDGEVIALREDGRPHPFQTTMRRVGKKKHDPALARALPLTPFWFDLLRVAEQAPSGGGHSPIDLIDAPLEERRRRLAALVPHRLTPSLRPASIEQARAFLDDVLALGHEGVMIKRLDSAYSAGHRGSAWLKLKPAMTLDLVVIAVEVGSGRRSKWLSNLHLAARDETAEGEVRWVMLGKTFKGMTDALLEWQTRELAAREIRREGHVVHVRPELVVEIAFQELEASPRYPGGMALRFARVKGYRPDKRPEDADTIETVRRLFEAGR